MVFGVLLFSLTIAVFGQDSQEYKGPAAEKFIEGMVALTKEKNSKKAIPALTEAIKLDPNFFPSYRYRGLAYGDTGQYDLAIIDFNQYIKLQPNSAEAYYFRGLTYKDKKDYDRAIADFDNAIRLDSKHADAYWFRGFVYASKSRLDKTLADWEMVQKINPNYRNGLNGDYIKTDIDDLRGILREEQQRRQSDGPSIRSY